MQPKAAVAAAPPLFSLGVLIAVSFLLLTTLSASMVFWFGYLGVGLSEIALVLTPLVLWLWRERVAPSAIGLEPARPLQLLGGALAGAAMFWLLALALAGWLGRLAPLPPEARDGVNQLIAPRAGLHPLALDLVVFALLPACAEELMFRGALLSALRPRLGTVGAVVGAAIAFSLYHASVPRLIPTFAGGLVFGALRVLSGSLWPALVAHAVNNAALVIATRHRHETVPSDFVWAITAVVTLIIAHLLTYRKNRQNA